MNRSAAKGLTFVLLLGVAPEVFRAVPGPVLSVRLSGREGQARSAAGADDIKAIVKRLEARYQSASTLKAAFLERYSEGGRLVRVESGTAYFSRPGRMRWEYESPEPKLFIADGKTVWFYVPADRTVSRAKMKESEDWRTPLSLLTGKAKLARLCGRIDLAEPARGSATPGTSAAQLRCLPRGVSQPAGAPRSSGAGAKQEESGFLEVFLTVNPETGELSRVLIHQPGGVEVEFRFGNWQYNPPLAESFFHFQAPVGVAIVEESSIANGPR